MNELLIYRGALVFAAVLELVFAAWILRLRPADREKLDRIPRAARLAEIFAVNLRTVAGWTPELWSQVPHADSWERRYAVVAKSAENMPQRWWKISRECIKLSAEGLVFWNTVAEALLP